MTTRRSISAFFSRATSNREGGAAVEFAILAPILALVLAGVVDFGGVVFVNFGINSTVSSTANFALVNRADITPDDVNDYANTLAAILTNGGSNRVGEGVDEGTIVVNNSTTVTITGGVPSAAGGTNDNADNCYCPTPAAAIVWGAPAACGSDCGGGRAGRFVEITASRIYTPLFSNYGLVNDQRIAARAVVQVE